jgi:tryptophan 2,3-dioxygenase
MEIARANADKTEVVEENVVRVNRYFRHLIQSFDIMTDGMRPEEFLKFRMALLPASGFQSFQFRHIEICSTPLINLMAMDERAEAANFTQEELYERIYWKKGAIDLDTGEKTLTLRQFEKQYDKKLFEISQSCAKLNLYNLYLDLKANGKASDRFTTELRQLDVNVNVNWRLAHYKSAVRYLQKGGAPVSATGGTNWQKFLPPRFQRVIAFPALWSEQEINEWGKSWITDNIPEVG